MAEDARKHARAMLDALGLDAEADPELGETPKRFVELLESMSEGLKADPPSMSTFDAGDGEGDRPVILTGLSFHSLCVHHLVPFFGTIDVAYLPDAQMTGFGSVGRVIDHFAAKPQLQERLVDDIADHIDKQLQPRGVLIRCRARQMCMELTGAQKQGRLISITSRGALNEGPERSELLSTFRQETTEQ
jgi:GTP cyclohydrolase I